MSQNKLITFVHNNLVVTIIAALIIGGGLSSLAFLAYNSGVNSTNDSAMATNTSSISSSSTVKSSIVSSSVLSSSNISSSSAEIAKIDEAKEAPKIVEVEKLKAVEKTSEPIKFVNSSDLIKVPEEELSCFGRKNEGESAFKANYGNSMIYLNTIQNLKNLNVSSQEKIKQYLDFMNNGELSPKEGSYLGKYQNPGYALFGCSNYASGTNKLITVKMKNVDQVKSYLSFGSQGGVPSPSIEIYAKKGNYLLRIFKFISIDVENISVSCGGETGGIGEQNIQCFYGKVSKILTDQYLESKVQELVDLYSIE